MRKITAFIIILSAVSLQAAEFNGYMGTPLFNYRVQDNTLPDGEYTLIRSYRNITQLLVSTGRKIILYTDRDNEKESEIFVSSYSRIDSIILSEPALTQHEFNIKIESIITQGDMADTSTIRFYGADKYMDDIKKGLKAVKNEWEYYIFHKEKGKDTSLMTLNPSWKKLTLRNLMNENNHPINFYNIYIDECYDKNIKRIIRGYSAVIKNLNTEK